MLKIMVRPSHASRALLGIGTYYVSAAHDTPVGAHRWQQLELKNPMICDRDQVAALIYRHDTNSPSPRYAVDGAWALRHEVVAAGHDGIVAVDGVGEERHLTIVHFDAATGERPTAQVIDFAPRKAAIAVPAARKIEASLAREMIALLSSRR